MTRGINIRKNAEQLGGNSGAEIKCVCTEACMYALRERRVHVTQEEFKMAIAKYSDKNMSRKLYKLFSEGVKGSGDYSIVMP